MTSRRAAKLATSILALALMVSFTPGGTAAGNDQLQQRLDELVAAGAPGAILLVRGGDRTVRLTSGYGELERKAPPGTTDRFRVGSLTKTFVSVLMLQLAAEGKLTLEDTVEHWLPGVVPGGEKMTIRQLLNMKAGLYDYPDDPQFLAAFAKGDWAHKWRPRQLARIGVSHKALFAPGRGWAYCNTCYVLAGLIIEKATGKTVGSELKTRIFTPLHLHGTTFDTRRVISGPHVHGYVRSGGRLVDTSLLTPSWAWAAGGIVSTPDDIATFYRALLSGRLLEREQLNQMTATVAAYSPTQRYGLGIAQFPSPCGKLWGNGGDIVGYNSSAYASKDGKRQFVLFVNLDEMSFTKKIRAALNRIYLAAFCG
jgi:D-alanyl-D-alanine carboxypeptidase